MAVLSDETIRSEIAAGRLILDGSAELATHCVYEFHPGKIFPAGTHDDGAHLCDWTDEDKTSDQRYSIQPAALVWIRTKQRVSMPDNMCGIWMQTNTLSRQGMLLINCSLIEPGYTGYLSCNFVNFGREPVLIRPSTPIAKLLFLQLDKDALVPFRKRIENYDHMVGDIAARGSKSFLQITEMATQLDRARAEAELSLKAQRDGLLAELRSSTVEMKENEIKAFKSDAESYIKKASGVVFAGFLVFGLAFPFLSGFGNYLRGLFSHEGKVSKTDVAKIVDESLMKRLVWPGCPAGSPAPPTAPVGTDAPAQASPALGADITPNASK